MTTTTDVTATITVDVPLEKAFRVFTDGIDSWWPRDYHIGEGTYEKHIIEPYAGGRCYIRETEGAESVWGKVLDWDPPRHLALAWAINVRWQLETEDERMSRVDINFAPTGPEQTTLTVVHSQLERHGDGWESMRESVGGDGGWPGLLRLYAASLG